MLNTSVFIDNYGRFTIAEESYLYKVPFEIIYSWGRRLFFYSDRNSTTPVKDWYNKLNEQNKEEIQIVSARELKTH